MALDLHDAGASAGAAAPTYQLFAPEISQEALVTLQIHQPAVEPPAPPGTRQVASSTVVMDAGSLSLARAYGYPTQVSPIGPSRVTGTLSK